MYISCFLKDKDPISKICRISFDRSSGFSAPVFSEIVNTWIFKKMSFIKIIFRKNDLVSFDYLGYLGSPKIKMLVLRLGDTSPNPEIIEMRSFGLSHKQIEKI